MSWQLGQETPSSYFFDFLSFGDIGILQPLHNESSSNFQPFHKPKVKIKNEIVPMNLRLNSKDRNLKTHLEPKDWNKLIKNKDTHIIDARKPFEYKVPID